MGISVFILVVLVVPGFFFQTGPTISAPQNGAILTGRMEILGSLGAPGFSSAELAFAYAADTTGTWFFLQELPGSVQQGPLALWDTSQLTDGDYRLRLRVFQADGSSQEAIVEELHIRNDAPPATPTLFQTLPSETPESLEDIPEAVFPTLSLQSTPEVMKPQVPLPANPAELDQGTVYSIFGRSAILVMALFAALGLLLRTRRH